MPSGRCRAMEGTASLPHCTPTRRSMPARRSAGAFLCDWRKNVWRVPLTFMYMYMLYVLAECSRGVPSVPCALCRKASFCLSPWGERWSCGCCHRWAHVHQQHALRCEDSRCVSNFIMGVETRTLVRNMNRSHRICVLDIASHSHRRSRARGLAPPPRLRLKRRDFFRYGLRY